MKLKDLTGQKFGRWEVIGPAVVRGKRTLWLCRCSCGTEKEIEAGNLRSGRSKSCGCLATEVRPQNRLVGLTGKSFGRLLVKGRAPKRGGRVFWWCECSCGADVEIEGRSLKNGQTRSCGCLHREVSALRKLTHGLTNTKEWLAWTNMKQRCLNPNDISYKNYGGKGISVYEPWLHDFPAFLKHVGPAPGPEYSIDRIEVGRGYEPGNLRWATRTQQGRNKRSNKLIGFVSDGGQFVFSQTEWAERLGMTVGALKYRLNHKIDELGDAMERHVIEAAASADRRIHLQTKWQGKWLYNRNKSNIMRHPEELG